MIAADIAELDSRLKQLTLQIRDKELALFTTNFGVLGTKSAFLCGLGWSGLTAPPVWQYTDKDPAPLALVMFVTLDSLSICFNLFTMALSTWCMINGPALARATKGCFNVTSTRVFSDQFCQKKHSSYENLRRDDHSSKNELKRVETG